MLNFSCARRGGPWMAPTRRLGDWPRSTFAVIEIAEAGISIGLQDAGVPGEMLRWVFATAIARIEEHGRRRVRPGKRPVVPDIGPQAAGDRLTPWPTPTPSYRRRARAQRRRHGGGSV